MIINNIQKHERCPLCHSTKIKIVDKLSSSRKVTFCSEAVELAYVPELWKCEQCKSGFIQNIIQEHEARVLYTSGQSQERWLSESFREAKMSNMTDAMTKIFKNKGMVLDVGCNTGELLDFAKSFGCKTAGVEYSIASRGIVEKKGHMIYSSFEDVDGYYDVITAFDLVEHLYNLPMFLKHCEEKLKARGKLIIATGNINSLSSVLAGSRWWYAQYPEHIVFPSINYFSEYSGLEVEKYIKTYASKGYKNSLGKLILRFIKLFILGKTYNGLPPINSDHLLVVLTK